MHARFLSAGEIQKVLKSEHNINLTTAGILFYRNSESWAPTIERLRNIYLTNLMEVPIAHKRIRLERLEELYDKAKNKGAISTSKDILVAARDELENKTSNLNIIMNRIEMISDDELTERMQKIKEEMANTIDLEPAHA